MNWSIVALVIGSGLLAVALPIQIGADYDGKTSWTARIVFTIGVVLVALGLGSLGR